MKMPEVSREILEVAIREYERSNRPIFVSRLGQALNGTTASNTLRQHGLSLLAYIRSNLAGEFEIITNSDAPLVHLIEPKPHLRGAHKGESTATQSTAKLGMAVSPAVWAAFRKPLRPGFRRFLKLDPMHFFSDSDSPPGDPSFLEVTASDIQASASPEKVYESISTWAHRNSIEVSLLEKKKLHPKRGESSLLERVLSSLSEEQLQRLALPADIVASLLRA